MKIELHKYSKIEELNSLELKGGRGVPWVQIIENEFECLVVRDGVHFAEKFVPKLS